MSLDNRIIIGTRVLIIASHSSNPRNNSRKSRFIGYTAIVKYISSHSKDKFPYSLVFDEIHLNEENRWCWTKDEIMYLEDQNYVR